MPSRREAGPEEGPGHRNGPGNGPSAWERVVAAVSALVVLGSVGFMLYEVVAVPATPPEIEVLTDSIGEGIGGYRVHVSARNHGGKTVASLLVEGELADAGGTLETAEVVLDYVPAGGTRSATLLFARDPRAHSLEVRARGYDTP